MRASPWSSPKIARERKRMGKDSKPPEDSNKGQGKPGDKDEGQSDEDFYQKQADEATQEGNGGKKT